MVQTISEGVEGGTPAEPDSSDAAGGGGGGGGDAGGGGRDDARVAELTKLLCTVHDMSSQVLYCIYPGYLSSQRMHASCVVLYATARHGTTHSLNLEQNT